MRHRPFPLKKHKLPLHFAISNKMTSEVRCLIEGGCDVDARDQNKRTALMLCCLENDEHWSAGVTRMLLQAGADAASRDANGRNALMFAVIFLRKSIIDILLMAIDFDINQRDVDGRTALHYAMLRGDDHIIKQITNACGRQILMPETFSPKDDFMQHDVPRRIIQKRKNSIFYDPTRPIHPCKAIVQGERSTAQIHKSNSIMNVHQFRRGTMQKYYSRAAWKHRSLTTSSGCSTTSSSSRSMSVTLPNDTTVSERRYRMGTRFSFDNTRQYLNIRHGDRSWKAYSSMFWDILSEQCSPTYRKSANPILQTLEQALGLPPKEEMIEDDVVSEAETIRSTKNQLSLPRRGSTPNSPSPTSMVQSLSEKDRRRSEASLGISPPQLKSLNDTKIRNLPKAVEEKLNSPNNSTAQQQQTGSSQQGKTDPVKQQISVNNGPNQAPLIPSSSRQNLAVAPKKSAQSPRTPIVRNRPGSALRQRHEQEEQSQYDMKAPPIIKIDMPDNSHNNKSNNSPQVTKKESKKNAVHENNQSPSESTTLQPNVKRREKAKEQLDVPQRKPARRPESIVFRDRVLSDIMEENESPVNGRNTERATFHLPESNDKSVRYRPTSAYVRGRLANGRLLR